MRKAKQKSRFVFRQDDAIIVFKIGKTSNKKIAEANEKIMQTYSYSIGQFNEAIKPKTTMIEFFSQDASVCGDCPFAVNNGAKLNDCYTHKRNQYSGFLSQLRSVAREFESIDNIPTFDMDMMNSIAYASTDKFVRFGTYGEPTLIPYKLITMITARAKNWTGYTHQWAKKRDYSKYFMASTHNLIQEKFASDMGFRSFVSSDEPLPSLVSCPASKESGFKSNCSKCGLCSGTEGKGDKSVAIIKH